MPLELYIAAKVYDIPQLPDAVALLYANPAYKAFDPVVLFVFMLAIVLNLTCVIVPSITFAGNFSHAILYVVPVVCPAEADVLTLLS